MNPTDFKLVSPSVNEALTSFLNRHPKKIDLSLGRLEQLLEKLGNPHHNLPPTLHIAGTNGKGSTQAFCRTLLETQGLTVHTYTSPHLIRFNERIRLTGELVSDELLLQALNRVEAVLEEQPITFFEATTAAAFLLFSEIKADALILEVGLGGRFDATNIHPNPAISILAPIGLDHQEFLGSDIAQIAVEKCGIMRKGVPVVCGVQTQEIQSVIYMEAAQKKVSQCLMMGQDFDCYIQHGRLVVQTEQEILEFAPPKLAGLHQTFNAGLAVMAVKTFLKEEFNPAQSFFALQQTIWPARMQRVNDDNPLMKLCAPHAELWIDGGHNAHAAEQLALTLSQYNTTASKPLILITGMLDRKDPHSFLRAFEGLAAKVLTVPVRASDAGLSPEILASVARDLRLNAKACPSLEAALNMTKEWDTPRIVVCGSLYLAAEALEMGGLYPQ